jgi:hypothetical protein
MSVYCISSCMKPGHVSISISPHYSHFVFPVKISKRHVEQALKGYVTRPTPDVSMCLHTSKEELGRVGIFGKYQPVN